VRRGKGGRSRLEIGPVERERAVRRRGQVWCVNLVCVLCVFVVILPGSSGGGVDRVVRDAGVSGGANGDGRPEARPTAGAVLWAMENSSRAGGRCGETGSIRRRTAPSAA
jgi:hypothetical protein